MAKKHRRAFRYERVLEEVHLYEELADIIIRVFSYAGGNGMALQLANSIADKIEKNAARPYLHGKKF